MSHPAVNRGFDLGDNEQGQLHNRQVQDELNQQQPNPSEDKWLDLELELNLAHDLDRSHLPEIKARLEKRITSHYEQRMQEEVSDLAKAILRRWDKLPPDQLKAFIEMQVKAVKKERGSDA